MATRVELHKDQVKDALQKALDSAKRAMNNSKLPQFKELYEKQLADLNNAINTLQDTK